MSSNNWVINTSLSVPPVLNYANTNIIGTYLSYNSNIDVNTAINTTNPTIVWGPISNIFVGTALSSTQLNATISGNIAGSFDYTSNPSGTILPPGTSTLYTTFTPSNLSVYNTVSANNTITVNKITPSLTWSTPNGIIYGTSLSSTQLNASANVAGVISYASNPAGTILGVGNVTLNASFTANSANYNSTTASTTLSITQATPTLTTTNPSLIVYGTLITSSDFTIIATNPQNLSNITNNGTITYSPTLPRVFDVGNSNIIATFTPTDSANYIVNTATLSVSVTQYTPTSLWGPISNIMYSTPLSTTQYNVEFLGYDGSAIPGIFTYHPPIGTILNVGTFTLTTTFTPTSSNYTSTSATNTITVTKFNPTISWSPPANLGYSVPITEDILGNPVCNDENGNPISGTFIYNPPLLTNTLPLGPQTMTATFYPTNTTTYNIATVSTTITITKYAPTIYWPSPSPVDLNYALTLTQLNAIAQDGSGNTLEGTYVYTPSLGNQLGMAGFQILSVSFTPNDTTDFEISSGTTTITVNQATPNVYWNTPKPMILGQTVSSDQFNLYASVPGTFSFPLNPIGSYIPTLSNPTLRATFTPDSYNYTEVSLTNTVSINTSKQITYISNFNELQTWVSAPFTQAVLISDITNFNVATWVSPSSCGIEDGILFDGNGHTITFDNTQSNGNFGGIFMLTGGIIQDLAINVNNTTFSGMNDSTALLINNINSYGKVQKIIITNAAILSNVSLFVSIDSAVEIKNCQIGTITNPIQINYSNIGGYALSGYDAETTFSQNIAYVALNQNTTSAFLYAPHSFVIDQCYAFVTVSNTRTNVSGFIGGTITNVIGSITNSFVDVTKTNFITGSYSGFINQVGSNCTITISNSYEVGGTTTLASSSTYNSITLGLNGTSSLTVSGCAISTTNSANVTSATNMYYSFSRINQIYNVLPFNGWNSNIWDVLTYVNGVNLATSLQGWYYCPILKFMESSPYQSTTKPFFYNNDIQLSTSLMKTTTTIIWNPSVSTITYGTPLSLNQLNATTDGWNLQNWYKNNTEDPTCPTLYMMQTSSFSGQSNPPLYNDPFEINVSQASNQTTGKTIIGQYIYNYELNQVLNVGTYNLTLLFIPNDVQYQTQQLSRTLTVEKATPQITWGPITNILQGTPLSSTQLNATANVPGTFDYSYNPIGTILTAGISQTLYMTFIPDDLNNYNIVYDNLNTITVYQNFYITDQSTLATWISTVAGSPYLYAYLQNDITIDLNTWTDLSTSPVITSLYSLDGQNYNILLNSNGNTISGWNGLIPLNGGLLKNFTLSATNQTNIELSNQTGILTSYCNGGIGTIQNVMIYNINIQNGSECGGFVGSGSHCVLQQCQIGVYSNITVISSIGSGGFAGSYFAGNITQSISWSNVEGISSGGFVGSNAGICSILQSISEGEITGSDAGGFCGGSTNQVTIQNCYSVVSVSNADSNTFIGSLADGSTNSLIAYCYALGTNITNSGTIVSAPSGTNINIQNIAMNGDYLNTNDPNLTGGYTEITGSTNITNYTKITENTIAPISNFSSTSWNLTKTPPTILIFESSVYKNPDETQYNSNYGLNYKTYLNIIWPNPNSIQFTVLLNTIQLNAKTDTVSDYVISYSSNPIGTLLQVGTHQLLTCTCTPTDTTNYFVTTGYTSISVSTFTPNIVWDNPAPINYNIALSSTQLNAIVYDANGNIMDSSYGLLVYTPDIGTFPTGGNNTLSVEFIPAMEYVDSFNPSVVTVELFVNSVVPVISWTPPTTIPYGTPLSETELNATITNAPPVTMVFNPMSMRMRLMHFGSSIGEFQYTPGFGEIIPFGSNTTIQVEFIPSNDNYIPDSSIGTIQATQATSMLSWPIVAISYGIETSLAQFNAIAVDGSGTEIPGTMTYYNVTLAEPFISGVILEPNDYTLRASFTPNDTSAYTSETIDVSFTVNKGIVNIIWGESPAPINYGTPLTTDQLNATVIDIHGDPIVGTLTYDPPLTTILDGGLRTLSVSFVPDDLVHYENLTYTTRSITILPINLTLNWGPIVNSISYGTPLSSTQLNATATGLNDEDISSYGTFTYTPDSGSIIEGGVDQELSVIFTPSVYPYSVNYNSGTFTNKITVTPISVTIQWEPISDIVYGTVLSSTQLNAIAIGILSEEVPGIFAYNPGLGSILSFGLLTPITCQFYPDETVANNYIITDGLNYMNVLSYTPTFTWNPISSITYGTPLSSIQLNAIANGPIPSVSPDGTIFYTPGAGTILPSGGDDTNRTVIASYVKNSDNYTDANTTQIVTVNPFTPIIVWSSLANIQYGTAITSQLNAVAYGYDGVSVLNGTYAYTANGSPINIGDVLPVNTYTLGVTFTPNPALYQTNYAQGIGTNTLVVSKLIPNIIWPSPANITYGTSLSILQLNAVAKNNAGTVLSGSFSYSPSFGIVLNAGTETLTCTFTPDSSISSQYESTTGSTTIVINKLTPSILWIPIEDITYGTPLSEAQLNANALTYDGFILDGIGTYNPTYGTILTPTIPPTPAHLITFSFVPFDTNNYNNASATNTVIVAGKLDAVVVWSPPSTIDYNIPLTSKQLNAQVYETDGVTPLAGTGIYTPTFGYYLPLGTNTLNFQFTPTDPYYNEVDINRNIDCVENRMTAILTQNDLYEFFNSSYYTIGVLYNNITIDATTWNYPTLPFTSTKQLMGGGFQIIILSNTTDNQWPGLVNLQGGNLSNFTLQLQGMIDLLPNNIGYIAGNSNSSGIINGVKVKGFDILSYSSGGFVGVNSTCTIDECEMGSYLSYSTISSDLSGGFAGNSFAGSIINSICYCNISGTNSGGFIGTSNGGIVSKSRANGTITGNNSGGFVGSTISGGKVTILNSYSLYNVSNSTSGGITGNIYFTNSEVLLQNVFYLGNLVSGAGAVGKFEANTTLGIMNVATQGQYFSTGSYGNFDQYNIQYFNNSVPSSSIFSGFNGEIIASAYDSTNNLLYVGGNFNVPFNRIAVWNGTQWNSLRGGTNDYVNSILPIGNKVYVGGRFTQVGNSQVSNYFAIWDITTQNWTTFGTQINGAVNSIISNSSQSTLYIGGEFNTIQSINIPHIASYHIASSSWNSIGEGLNGDVLTLALYNDSKLYVGGVFTASNDSTPILLNYIGLWNINTQTWSSIESGLNGFVYSVAINPLNGYLYVGGNFTQSGDLTTQLNRIAIYDGSSWNTFGSGANDIVYALSIQNQTLFIGGSFTTLNDQTSYFLTSFDLSTITQYGYVYYLDGSVRTFSFNQNIMYIGGNYSGVYKDTSFNENSIPNMNNIGQINLTNNINTYSTSYSSTLQPISNFTLYPN